MTIEQIHIKQGSQHADKRASNPKILFIIQQIFSSCLNEFTDDAQSKFIEI